MESVDIINNTKRGISLHKNVSRFNGIKTFYFPSLTHKELLSINDLKHKVYSKSKNKIQKNSLSNFHTEVLKNNIKGN